MIIQDLSDFVFSLLYAAEKYILYLIDFTVNIFSILSGLEKVDFNGESRDVLIFFTESSKIKEAFYMILLLGVILLFMFTFIAVLKSEGEEAPERKSKGRIISASFKGFTFMVLMPFLMLALVYLSSALLSSVNTAVNGGAEKTLIGGELFVTSAHGAFKGDEGIRDYVEQHFISGEYSYMDESIVKQYYSLDKINYIIGTVIPLINLLMLLLCTMSFTERIFASVFLYLISPLVLATYPLDNGYRFKEFKELLISELISSYGIMVLLGILGIILPEISHIRFMPGGLENGIIKTIIITGGIYSVTKGDRYIASLVKGPGEGGGLREIISVVSGGIGALKGGVMGAAGAFKTAEKQKEKREISNRADKTLNENKEAEKAIKNEKKNT